MACYTPLRVYEGKKKPNGKINIVWKKSSSWQGEKLSLPCGKCIGCFAEKARQWAVRCVHEASLYEKNCFITLTYDENHIPYGESLDKTDFPLFMKRLRKKYGEGIRYYMCGEYGEKLGRPHYHALLFNHDFEDKVLYSVKNNKRLYISDSLSKLWPFGFSTSGDVSYESASYVARYVMKKMNIEDKKEHYGDKQPEYTCMSRMPGLGTGWYKKFKEDMFPEDELVVNGYKQKPPRFYDKLLDKENSQMYKLVKENRKRNQERMVTDVIDGKVVKVSDSDSFRLPVKEEVFKARMGLYKRPLEEM